MSSAAITIPVRWVAHERTDGKVEIGVYINGNRSFTMLWDPVAKTMTEIVHA